MAGPEYDFFATGLRPAPAPAVPAPPVSPGGTSIVPGGAGPEVSRFGLPADAVAAPTGPLAAPGYVAEPVPSGLAAWDGAAPVGRAALRQAADAQRVVYDVRPGAVQAAGVIAIVGGVLTLLLSGLALLAVLALLGSASAAGAPGGLVAGVLLAAVLLVGISVGYLMLGVLVTRGRRWAAWTLLVLSALSLAVNLYQGLSDGDLMSLGPLLQLAVPTALVLLLSVGEGGRWLRRS